MSKIDKYKGDGQSKGDVKRSGASLPAVDYGAKADEAVRAGKALPFNPRRVGCAIALDATGSMDDLISDARRNIAKIISRAKEIAKCDIKVRFYAYRDYDVGSAVCEKSSMTADASALERWLGAIKAFGGGANAGEAIEAALADIYAQDDVHAVLVVGDEPSNPRTELNQQGLRNTKSAHEWSRAFADRHVPIHTFVVGSLKTAAEDFETIARISGGQTGRLDSSAAMVDMAAMAILAGAGTSFVKAYMENYALSDSSKQFGNLLLGGPKKS